MNRVIASIVICSASVVALNATASDVQGIRLGGFQIKPQLRVLGAHDKEQGADGNFFSEAEMSAGFQNSEARYDLGGSLSYGYRAYDSDVNTTTNSNLDGDFYGVGVTVASQESPLKWTLTGQQKKTVDYDIRVADGAGSDLGAVLTRSTSTRASVRVATEYEKSVAGNAALLPGYEGWYYRQTFDGTPDAEWHEHTARLRYGYNLESLIVLSLSGSYTAQFSGQENGAVANVSIGVESHDQEKLSWKAQVGVSAADYEQSGSDQGMEASLNARWQATDKVSAYVFGSTSYEPGYAGYGGGTARRVYRAGYGGDWAILDRVRINAQLLHDRQEEIESGLATDRHFAMAQVQYEIARRIVLALGGSCAWEDIDPDRSVIFCSATLRY